MNIQNKAAIQQAIDNFENSKQSLQTILSEFEMLNIGSLSIEELANLCAINADFSDFKTKIEDFVQAKIESQLDGDKLPKIGNFTMDKRQAAKAVGIPSLDDLFNVFHLNVRKAHNSLPLAAIHKGKIVLDSKKHDKMVNQNTIKLTTEKQKKLYQALTSIQKAIESCADHGLFIQYLATGSLFQVTGGNFAMQRVTINPAVFRDQNLWRV